MENQSTIKEAFKASIPVMAGYLALGAGFGILMSAHDFQIMTTFLMSLIVYAGTLQFVAVSLLANHASYGTIGLTSFLISIRHVFYGISVIDRYRGAGWKKAYLMFALTDETYSLIVADQPSGPGRLNYYFYMSLFNHIYWIIGGVVGAILGKAIAFNSEGIDFVLTALFVTIVVDQYQEYRQGFLLLLGLLFPLLCLIVFGPMHFMIPSLFGFVIILLGFKGRLTNDCK